MFFCFSLELFANLANEKLINIHLSGENVNKSFPISIFKLPDF